MKTIQTNGGSTFSISRSVRNLLLSLLLLPDGAALWCLMDARTQVVGADSRLLRGVALGFSSRVRGERVLAAKPCLRQNPLVTLSTPPASRNFREQIREALIGVEPVKLVFNSDQRHISITRVAFF
jgi:hypothetical protein